MKQELKRKIVNKMTEQHLHNDCCALAGQMAEHSLCLELFAPLFLSIEKVEIV